MNTSSRSSATAAVLTEFLPVYDKMNALKEAYADNEFGSKFSGLTMNPTFSKLGVNTDLTVAVGDTVDYRTMKIVESRHSDEFDKDIVMEVVSANVVELEGNVMRPAEVVVSLGVPEPEEDPAEGEADDGAGDAEEPPAPAKE
jgi:molecular chaperone GrpE (heat shock protein)